MEISHNTSGQIHCARFGIAEVSARLESDVCSLFFILDPRAALFIVILRKVIYQILNI